MRFPTRILVPAVLALALVACEQTETTSPNAAASQFGVAGKSGCYTVKVSVTAVPVGPVTVAGTLAGDLEGTIEFVFDVITPFTGVTNTAEANTAWHITGGIASELIGQTFHTRLKNRNILPPGETFATNVGSHRAIDGVEKANITYIGETSIVTGVTRLEHNGVLCP